MVQGCNLRRRARTAGALIALAAAASACSFEPIREVDGAATRAEPASLAFDDPVAVTTDTAASESGTDATDDARRPATAADEPARATGADEFLDQREPAAWTVATTDAGVGVHSAPDHRYTRMGVLGPGDNVIGTGRSVATGTVRWIEIRWGDDTAWVIEAALGPVP